MTAVSEPKPHLSGWCSGPYGCTSPRAHAICQDRLDRGLNPRGCDCLDHTPTEDTP